jgi:hypothetical protein
LQFVFCSFCSGSFNNSFDFLLPEVLFLGLFHQLMSSGDCIPSAGIQWWQQPDCNLPAFQLLLNFTEIVASTFPLFTMPSKTKISLTPFLN